MAGPLNGIGAQPQIPLATTFQPGQNEGQVRQQQERQPQENLVQPQGTASAETQNTETGNQDILRAQQETALSGERPEGDVREQRRGSVIDITV